MNHTSDALVDAAATANDLAERKRAELTLRKIEERHRLALDATSDGIWDIDFEDGTVHFNGPYAAAFGTPADNEEPWAWWMDHVHPDDRERTLASFNAALSGSATIWKCEYRFRRIDGTWANTDDHAHISRDSKGKAQYVVGAVSDITGTRRAEAALRASEEEFRSLAEAMPQIVWATRNDGWNTYFNQQWVDYTGLTQEESRGHGWNIPFHPDDQRRASDAWENATKTGGSYSLECRLRRADGVYRWWLIRGVPLVDETGNIIKWYGTCTDIEDMKQSAAALLESNSRFRAYVDYAPDGVFVMDAAGFYREVNNAACRLLGYSREELLQMHVTQCRPAAAHGEVQVSIQALRRDGWHSGEFTFLRKDGSLFVGLLSAATIDDNHYVGFVKDISERKRAEEALGASELRYRRLFEAAKDGVMILDAGTGAVVDVNPFLVELLGYSRQDFLGKKIWELGFFKDIVANQANFEELQREQYVRYEDMPLQTSDGRQIDVEFVSNVYLVADHNVIQCNVRDITERNQGRRNQATLEAQLQQSQKMESVGRLAGGVAHDFNNMLSVILGRTELAMEHVSPDQPLHADLKEIRGAAIRSANLTRQLLAFARKQTIAPKVLDLNETVAGMLTMLERLIGENIDLRWKPGQDLWSVNMDPSQVDQILANLCVNGRDAIAGVGKMTIETANSVIDEEYCATHEGCKPGQYVRLAVSDDGCGMDTDTLLHLFEPFFTTKGTGEGTGLGLATVYGAVKQNSGHIYTSSELGRGTTFTIFLPRHQQKAVQPQTERTTALLPGGHETMLLVEDEPAILTLTRKQLERLGYTVLAANTPGEAIRLAEQHGSEIHLLMTDVVMPEMNGRVLAHRLLAIHPPIKILFMSGYTADVIAHQGVLDDGVRFIQKPFTFGELATKIREALDAEG